MVLPYFATYNPSISLQHILHNVHIFDWRSFIFAFSLAFQASVYSKFYILQYASSILAILQVPPKGKRNKNKGVKRKLEWVSYLLVICHSLTPSSTLCSDFFVRWLPNGFCILKGTGKKSAIEILLFLLSHFSFDSGSNYGSGCIALMVPVLIWKQYFLSGSSSRHVVPHPCA